MESIIGFVNRNFNRRHTMQAETAIEVHAMEGPQNRTEPGTMNQHCEEEDGVTNSDAILYDQKTDSGGQESSVDGMDIRDRRDGETPRPNQMNDHDNYGDYITENEYEEEEMEECTRDDPIINPQDLGTVLQNLTKAISKGDFEIGYAMLKALTDVRAEVSLHLLSVKGPRSHDNIDHPFSIEVTVETATVYSGPTWKLQVRPSMTIFGMKIKVALLYGIPISVQRWLIGRKVAADHETIQGNQVVANSKLVLFIIKKRRDLQEEMMIIEGFKQKLLMEDFGNIELNFTEEEYTKYLQQARLMQHSSHQEIIQEQPQNGHNYQHHPQPMERNEIQPHPNHDEFQDNTLNLLRFRPPPVHSTTGVPQRVSMPSFSMNRQQDLAASRIGPSSNQVFPPPNLVQHGSSSNQVFPPPHLVQHGPQDHFCDPPERIDQSMQSLDPMAARKSSPPPHMDRKFSFGLKSGPDPSIPSLKSQSMSMNDLRLNSHDLCTEPPQFSPYHSLTRSINPSTVFQGHKNAEEDIDILFEDQTLQTRHHKPHLHVPKKKTHRRRIVRGNQAFVDQDLIHEKRHDREQYFDPTDDANQAIYQTFAPRNAFQHRERSLTPLPSADEVGWPCPECTFKNPPLVPGCRMCSHGRPEDYQIPATGSYVMDKDEARIDASLGMNDQAFAMMQVKEKETDRRKARKNRASLYQATEFNLVTNEGPFECPICFSEIEPGEGIRLQECLHELCRDCCADHIKLCGVAEVKCPYTDGDNACQQTILDREIRQIVGRDSYDEIVERSIKSAEATSANTFHCLTPNCKSFCFYDDAKNFFNCPICHQMNCLTCNVVHDGQNCQQYQDDIKLKARNDVSAQQTQEALQELLRQRRAMNCPKCGVIIQKKGGCLHMKCSMCSQDFQWTGIEM